MVDCDINGKIQWSWILEGEEKPLFYLSTVEPGNSKLVNSKQRVNSKLFLAAFQSVYNINHLLNSKLLAIVNLLLFLKKFTITRLDCIYELLYLSFSDLISVEFELLIHRVSCTVKPGNSKLFEKQQKVYYHQVFTIDLCCKWVWIKSSHKRVVLPDCLLLIWLQSCALVLRRVVLQSKWVLR